MATNHDKKALKLITLGDPIDDFDYLFGSAKPMVVEKDIQDDPRKILEFYRRLFLDFNLNNFQFRNERDGMTGIATIKSLLEVGGSRFHISGPSVRAKYYIDFCASPEKIKKALPPKTPYRMAYYPIFDFDHPVMTELLSQKKIEGSLYQGYSNKALLLSKTGRLYIVKASWNPIHEYEFTGDWSKNPRYHPEMEYVLEGVSVRHVQWDDSEILENIITGEWDDFNEVVRALSDAITASLSTILSRAEQLNGQNSHIGNMMSKLS